MKKDLILKIVIWVSVPIILSLLGVVKITIEYIILYIIIVMIIELILAKVNKRKK